LMLEEVVGAALAVCRRMLGARVVKVKIPVDLPLVKLDAVLMERLFVNLLENACKYASPGEPLAIDAVIDVVTDETAGRDRNEKFLKVSINDQGPGLIPGSETAIFEKFTRGDKESSTPGVGLGLAICRAIIEAHGGQIGARNRKNAAGEVIGASFWFTLPANDVAPEGAHLEILEEEALLTNAAALTPKHS